MTKTNIQLVEEINEKARVRMKEISPGIISEDPVKYLSATAYDTALAKANFEKWSTEFPDFQSWKADVVAMNKASELVKLDPENKLAEVYAEFEQTADQEYFEYIKAEMTPAFFDEVLQGLSSMIAYFESEIAEIQKA